MTATIWTAETLRRKHGQRLDSLTGLRFIAAFVVFGIHSLYYGQDSWTESVFAAGMTGVSFFYIVSGFVLAWTAREHDPVRSFTGAGSPEYIPHTWLRGLFP
ncbi:hypothetical protein D9V29_01735 [Mycetocola manganoxydans]|uniref:Acyltransferase 3 domain-containing protein n=1 Tax=Mycetocola manganoxydans TaxID=699879 RepID=A0A3L6ZZG3_9MICO|nr:hypothetical protein D9V29_01735 [Mycetocola manganoxydans]GHD41732.1 hypothetical protein GCM10008097_06830 [Mycetocola manganoxydans]